MVNVRLHGFLQQILYMEGTALLMFIWFVALFMALEIRPNGIFRNLMTMFSLTGTVCSILQFRYVLNYGFLPRDFVSYVTIVNKIGFLVTTLYFDNYFRYIL